MTAHPVDRALEAAECEPPSRRLEAIWSAYETATGNFVGRPPTDDQRHTVRRWVTQIRLEGDAPRLITTRRSLRSLASVSIWQKASWLAQAPCGACETVVEKDGSIPLSIFIPIDVDPWSAQSKGSLRSLFRSEVHAEMSGRGHLSPYGRGPLCVSVVSIVPAAHRDKDVDNLVKGLLDSLAGVIYGNDAQIQCLTSRKLVTRARKGSYFVRVDAVHPAIDDVIFDDGGEAVHRSARRVEP